jgi:Rrf2 family protein
VYKILKKLKKSGLVQIIRGIDGGCRLAADLHKVSLLDLIEIMEEDKLINACMQSGFQCSWQQKYGSNCMIHKKLQQIQKAIDAELHAHTLHQMIFGGN